MLKNKTLSKFILFSLLGLLQAGTCFGEDLVLDNDNLDGRFGSLGKIHLGGTTTVRVTDNATLNACDGLRFYSSFKVIKGGVLSVNVTKAGEDSDSDTIEDCTEMFYFADLEQSTTMDFDNDGLSNGDELTSSTDPSNFDTDGDGLPDGWESSPTSHSGETVKGSFYQYDSLGRIISKMRTTEN